jgi:hypothetical protein
MKSAIGAVLLGALWFVCANGAYAQCYYIADSAHSDDAAVAASSFAFPWRIGEATTDESRAVHDVFARTIEQQTRGFGRSWVVERTSHGRRYIKPNGISVDLRSADCTTGLALVRTYLRDLESIAPSVDVAGALAQFRQSAREVSRNEYDWANPPIPVMVEN